jgi:hypothetical protein
MEVLFGTNRVSLKLESLQFMARIFGNVFMNNHLYSPTNSGDFIDVPIHPSQLS